MLSIYDLQKLIDGPGGIDEAAKEMRWLNEEAKNHGFDGMHYQLIKCGTVTEKRSGFDRDGVTYKPDDLYGYGYPEAVRRVFG